MTLITPSLNFTNQVDGVSVNLENVVWDPTRGLVEPTQPIAGPLTDTQPVEENRTQVNGIMGLGPNTSFYNRILIEPALLELGNLLSSQSRTVRVWNGFLTDKALTDFQLTNADGINVLQPVALPYDIPALKELQYVVNISLEGPANIDAQLRWTIDGQEYLAVVTGTRVVVFAFEPNWSLALPVESLAWNTTVLRAFSGAEQRASIRTKARRTFGYSLSVEGQLAARLNVSLWGWQNRVFAVPVWTDRARLAQGVNLGDTQLNLPTRTYSFTAGAMAIIYSDIDTFEVVEIDQVVDGALRLVRGTGQSWEPGTLVMPILLGHLPADQPITRYTNNVLSASVTFTTDPSNTDPYTPDAVAPLVFEGLEVFPFDVNWSGGLSDSNEFQFQTMDAGTGRIQWDATEEFARTNRGVDILLQDREEILAFREMLGRLRGRAKTLWVPTGHEDFTVTAVIGAADNSIQVRDNSFRTLIGLNASRDHIMVKLNDGRRFYRRLNSVTAVGEDASLGITQSLGETITPDQVSSVQLLMRNRLSADNIALNWQTDRVVTVNSGFTSVRE